MARADRFLHRLAAGTPLSPTTALLARAGQEDTWALRLALAACLLTGAAQQAAAVLFFLRPQPTLLSAVQIFLLLGAVHLWGARWIVVAFASLGLLQALGLERWSATIALLFPLACALALLVRHLDHAAAERKAGGGSVAEPPSA